MKKIIAPVDFSESSVNAAKYAVQLASDIPDSSVTLYYVYETIIAGSDGTPLLIDPDARRNVAILALSNLKNELDSISKIPVHIVAEEGKLAPALEKYVKQNGADLIVMGITGSSKIEQLIIGSNTLNVISKDICPVFIIPGNADYKKIERALFTTDLKNVASSTPLRPLKKVLEMLKPELQIVHVKTTAGAMPESDLEEKKILESLLEDFKPRFFFILEDNFSEAIDDFAEDHDTNIIITVPRKHAFLPGLFKRSNTKKLAYRSNLPILALHSWE